MARKPKKDLGSVLAEANSAEPIEKPKRTRRKADAGWPCTAEQLIEERDKKGLSWRQVAINLDLGNPGAARSAYSELTGKHHSESGAVKQRAKKGTMTRGGKKVSNPNWNDDSDQDEIIERLTDASIVVRRTIYGMTHEEEVWVWRVRKLFFDGKEEDGPLCVELTQGHPGEKSGRGLPTRSFRVADIVSVR